MYNFSVVSESRLKKLHPVLVLMLRKGLEKSKIDFGVSETHRSLEKQKKLMSEGKTKTMNSKHLQFPSHAVDIFVANGYTFDFNHLCYLAGIFEVTFLEACEELNIEAKLRWGGNWDGDGVLIKDQKFQDIVHFEVIF